MPEPAGPTVVNAAPIQPRSTEEREEMAALGLLGPDGSEQPMSRVPGTGLSAAPVEKRALAVCAREAR